MKNKRGKSLILIAIIFIAIGISVLLFPKMTDILYKNKVEVVEAEFSQNPIKAEELYKELTRRNKILYEEKQSRITEPFSYEQTNIDLSDYGIKKNTIGFLKIPRMNLKLPILLGANSENMTKGATHLTETSYPIGGNNTNCVIAAHRGYSYTSMFRDIERLKLGDKIYISNFRENLEYAVASIKVIKPYEVDELLIQDNKDLVTLITCHPYRHNYQRYVVICERVVHNC